MLFKRQKKSNVLNGENPPLRHLGIIMDGNGRWATKRGLMREAGHRSGAEAFKRVVEHCIDRDIALVTVYAFSTENWKRPQSEVEGIIRLLVEYLEEGIAGGREKNSRVRFIGDRSRFSPEVQALMREAEEKSAHYPHSLNVALNYGGRADVVQAVNKLIAEGKREVSEEDISNALYTTGQPDPDLIIRTGGEMRLSNFLTWQSAYSELWFTPKLWPDITGEDIDEALAFYATRQRRFGDVAPKK
ncbi:MAG: di-trans,poly-cis-decaprenylcistransferase [Clostridia bacterium]|nr:di-trans,poly-cis-decaprenylcistransferase [Clostridia bacterium]